MCGRPGMGMPSFDEQAYVERSCYGQRPGSRPDNLQPTPRMLSEQEIDDVITYLQARIIGRGRITRDECLAYHEGQDDACEDFKLGDRSLRSGAAASVETETRRMRKLPILLLIGIGPTFVAAATGDAQRLELPAGPDRDLVSRACQTCHDLSMVLAAAGLTRDGWDAAIEEMITFGLKVEPDERVRLDYLSSRLGPSSASAPNK
jgi:hypothetical protein